MTETIVRFRKLGAKPLELHHPHVFTLLRFCIGKVIHASRRFVSDTTLAEMNQKPAPGVVPSRLTRGD